MSGGRRTTHRPVDWAAFQYQPDPSTPLLRCGCGAAWLDDEPGRQAHLTVFGHPPETRTSAESTERETSS